jgi:hypothetical protein
MVLCPNAKGGTTSSKISIIKTIGIFKTTAKQRVKAGLLSVQLAFKACFQKATTYFVLYRAVGLIYIVQFEL